MPSSAPLIGCWLRSEWPFHELPAAGRDRRLPERCRQEHNGGRVAQRGRQGGYHVPDAVVRRRFGAGLRDLFTLYAPIASTWQVFDNSAIEPRLIASRRNDRAVNILDGPFWR